MVTPVKNIVKFLEQKKSEEIFYKKLLEKYRSIKVKPIKELSSQENQLYILLAKYSEILKVGNRETIEFSRFAQKQMLRDYEKQLNRWGQEFNINSINTLMINLKKVTPEDAGQVQMLQGMISALEIDKKVIITQKFIELLTEEPDMDSINKLEVFKNQLSEESPSWLMELEGNALEQVNKIVSQVKLNQESTKGKDLSGVRKNMAVLKDQFTSKKDDLREQLSEKDKKAGAEIDIDHPKTPGPSGSNS